MSNYLTSRCALASASVRGRLPAGAVLRTGVGEGAPLLLFLVVIGAYCEIAAVHQLGDIGLTLTLFVGIIIVIHGLIIIGIGKLLVNDWDMIAIASQANIGGGATAMALAENFQRRELIVPAILVGTLGSALGTYLGFMVAGVL